ncbi:uncharacterized protein LOC105019103 [Esox lucius]|uniref:uncharacterized protein LOC105019103 n=1 Tax=Esox lucius TaxID=8010 RepID=UPI0005760FEC|nr:uncharacterized protein LOC105019103 [Esox lucius]XP_010883322.1 uncharacterized protein LOC105019103 [Esox lucius]
MRSLTWIEVILIMSQASGANENIAKWMANYPPDIPAKKGENVIIPCNVTYPPARSTDSIQAYWKKMGPTEININDKDKKEFLFHPNKTMVIKSFQGRTTLIGDISKGNCSLKIEKIENGDMGRFYLRITNGFDHYSFYKALVKIHEAGSNQSFQNGSNYTVSTVPIPLVTAEEHEKYPPTSGTIFVVTIVPGVVVLLVAVFGCVWFLRYKKRSRLVTEQESGYYANFTTTTPTPKTEIIKTTKKKDVPPPGGFEPIYINVQRPNDALESTDEMKSVYENVNCSKQ